MKITELYCEHMPALSDKIKDDIYCINTNKPHFSFLVDGNGENINVSYYKLIVSSTYELASDGVGDMYNSGVVYSSDITDIEYNGKPLLYATVYYFKIYAMVSERAIKSGIGVFATGIGDTLKLSNSFITAPDGYLKQDKEAEGKGGLPAPIFRRNINLDKKIASVYLYVTALGIFEFYINGKTVGNSRFLPGFTDYHKTLQYKFYDVTKYFKSGDNTVGAAIGDGWYKSNLSSLGRGRFGDKTALSAYFRIIYDDGACDELFTDGSWECVSSEYIFTDNQNGEFCDKRLSDKDAFTKTRKYGVRAVSYRASFLYGTKLLAATGPDVKEMMRIKPVSVNEAGGKYVVDMGQNMVGSVSVKLHCKEGTRITVRHGEMLNDAKKGERGCDGDEGTLYTANLRSAQQTDTYICRGYDDEYYPRFTFHGFRYVELDGLDYKPETDDITGHVLYSSCEMTGTVATSNASLNKLISNITWGHRGNFFSLPTDCPQRDERLGWTGDAQVFCKSACYGMDCAEFYKKYLRDIVDAQKPNGSVTDIAPMIKWDNGADLVGNGNAAWGDAIFVIPYTAYRMYGDKRFIGDMLPFAEKYYKMLVSTTRNYLRPDFGYGDWLSVNEKTPKDVLATAFLAYDAKLLSEYAEILGDENKAAYYRSEFDKIAEAFREEYLEDEDRIKGDTQCCYVLALRFGLVAGEAKKNAVDHLLRKIDEADGHLQTGFVGVSYLLPVLCDNGHAETAYGILLKDTYPSWLYSVKNGATTVWERWNSYTKENGFGDVGMNSFNHYSLGSCYEWFYEYMLGIKPLSPGYSVFSYRPYTDRRLDRASGSYRSASGLIRSEWRKTDSGFDLSLTVPVNTKARIEPDSGLYIFNKKGYTKITEKTELSSGSYNFKIPEKEGIT